MGEPNVHLEWGLHGVERAGERAQVVVIVDVMSFCSAVDVAVSRGASVIPFPYGDSDAAHAEAERLGALVAQPRQAGGGQLSLSPQSLQALTPGQSIVLPSPNGSRLSLAARAPHVVAGCLRNRAAVARYARAHAGGGEIMVVPAGERWPDGSLRPAIEDLLGAGAILHALTANESPEAATARVAYEGVASQLAQVLGDCVSGRELRERGFAADVALALMVDCSAAVPVLRGGRYTIATSP